MNFGGGVHFDHVFAGGLEDVSLGNSGESNRFHHLSKPRHRKVDWLPGELPFLHTSMAKSSPGNPDWVDARLANILVTLQHC